MAGENLTGNFRVLRPALNKAQKMFPKIRDPMELRANALKLRYWPSKATTDERGTLIDLDWCWIAALRGTNFGELRIADRIGGHGNIRIIFWRGQADATAARSTIWILEIVEKKRNDFTANELQIFDARRKLVIERFYKSRAP